MAERIVEKITEIVHVPSPLCSDQDGRAYVRGIDCNGRSAFEELDSNEVFTSRDKSIIFAVGNEVPFVEINLEIRAWAVAEREKLQDC